jgi:hypothetical protein
MKKYLWILRLLTCFGIGFNIPHRNIYNIVLFGGVLFLLALWEIMLNNRRYNENI